MEQEVLKYLDRRGEEEKRGRWDVIEGDERGGGNGVARKNNKGGGRWWANLHERAREM